MKQLSVTLGAIALMVVSAHSAPVADKIRVGLVLPDLSNAIIADIDFGARTRAKELGNVEVLTTGSYSGEEQASAVENYVAQHVDAIVYDSIDAAAVGPAIVKANAAHIPVIAIFSAAAEGKDATILSPDFTNNGRMIGTWMVGKLGKDGKVALVEGNPADAAGEELVTGFKEGLAAGGIDKLVASAPTDWDRQKAFAVATDILTAHPNLQGMYGANDDVALGAYQAIKAAHRKANILLAGQNGTCEALGALLRGELDYDVMNFAAQLGSMSVDVALKLKAGDTVPDFIKAPALGIDTATARSVAAGDISKIPTNIAADVRDRIMKAKNGCK